MPNFTCYAGFDQHLHYVNFTPPWGCFVNLFSLYEIIPLRDISAMMALRAYSIIRIKKIF
jgi:hypothetical protein